MTILKRYGMYIAVAAVAAIVFLPALLFPKK